MALIAHQRSDDLTSEPNVLPLIDVLLVLVIIAIVSLAWLIYIPAQIPPGGLGTGKGQGKPTNHIVLELRGDGSYAINHQAVAADQLVAQLHLIYDQRPEKILFIHADADRLYDDVVHAMDLAREAGVEELSLVTGEEAEGRSEDGMTVGR